MTETTIPTSQFAKDKIRKQILSLVQEYAALEFAPKVFVPDKRLFPIRKIARF